MIRAFFSLCLFINVKSSDVAELQEQRVREGDNVTINCHPQTAKGNKNGLVWYKQSIRKVPQYVVRTFEHDNKYRFARAFERGRFTMTEDEEKFNLNIHGVNKEDAGIYLCGKEKSNLVEFGSGIVLVVEGDDSVRRHESNPGITVIHANMNNQCISSSEAGSSTQSCVYKLPKRNLSLSDAGTYYCAVTACEETVFRKGDNCAEQMHVLAYLSISRVGFVAVLVSVLTVLHNVLTFRKHKKAFNPKIVK